MRIQKPSLEFGPGLGLRELPQLDAQHQSSVKGLYVVGDLADGGLGTGKGPQKRRSEEDRRHRGEPVCGKRLGSNIHGAKALRVAVLGRHGVQSHARQNDPIAVPIPGDRLSKGFSNLGPFPFVEPLDAGGDGPGHVRQLVGLGA